MEKLFSGGGPRDGGNAALPPLRDRGDTGMNELEQRIQEAKTSELALNELVASHKQWILRVTAETVRRYVTDSDDEWSAALSGFVEAVRSYDEGKGSFLTFAAVVIRRRVQDYLRSQRKYGNETDVTPAAFGEGLSEEESAGVNLQVQQKMAEESLQAEREDLAVRTRDEIAGMQATLQNYAFSFFDLADCSPRADKTRQSCALAVKALLARPDLFAQLRKTRVLPMRELTAESGVGRKILDRHRRYIIAAAEILSGDYPILSAYMDYIRKV